MTKKEKLRKGIKITAAWIENNKTLRCRGMVDDIEVAFAAAEVGVPSSTPAQPGQPRPMSLDDMKVLLKDLQLQIKANQN